jgi:riboflavin kinase/FMN adenylyltransferase
MQVIDNFQAARSSRPAAVSVGAYDGIHVGHQHLLRQMKGAADGLGYGTAVVTFHPRPQAVLAPHLPALHLTTPSEKISLLEQLGIDLTVLLPFTLELARTSAAEFVQAMVTRLAMRQLWVGPGFALGHNREGDVSSLQRMGQSLGFDVRVVEPLVVDGALVSSTRIRQLLGQGQIREATALLGHYPSLSGRVVGGAKRGRELGFPTANLEVPDWLAMPANGIYASYMWSTGQRRPAVTSIGVRPTFGETEHTVEAHLLNFDGELYGLEVKLELVDYLRPEIRFPTAAALIEQMRADVEQAARLLASEEATHPAH